MCRRRVDSITRSSHWNRRRGSCVAPPGEFKDKKSDDFIDRPGLAEPTARARTAWRLPAAVLSGSLFYPLRSPAEVDREDLLVPDCVGPQAA